jgi:hypothetical protein
MVPCVTGSNHTILQGEALCLRGRLRLCGQGDSAGPGRLSRGMVPSTIALCYKIKEPDYGIIESHLQVSLPPQSLPLWGEHWVWGAALGVGSSLRRTLGAGSSLRRTLGGEQPGENTGCGEQHWVWGAA